jgi:hypothetical protein
MDVNQIAVQELGIKIANLEITNAQLVAQLKILQEEAKKINEEQKETTE